MTVIGAHGDGNLAALHEAKDLRYYCYHVRVAVEVIGFVEMALAIALGVPKVKEMDVIAKSFHHAGQIVVWPHAVGARAKAKSVSRRWRCLDEFGGVLFGTHHAWQSQYRVGG